MRTFDYLYYKLYKAHLKGSLNDIAEWITPVSISILMAFNLLTIGALMRKLDLLPIFFTGKMQVVFFMVFLILGNAYLFLYKGRYKKIIAKYEHESEDERKRGNTIVWLYVVLTFLIAIIIPLYKPGVI